MTLRFNAWLRLIVLVAAVIRACCTVETCEEGFCQNQNASARSTSDLLHELCVDSDERCKSYAAEGKCESHPAAMYELCPKSCEVCFDLRFGLKQTVDREEPILWKERLEATRNYVENTVATDSLLKRVLPQCINKNELCTFWSMRNRCETHRGYMKIHCAPVCQTCEQLSDETRCPYEKETMPDAWKAGDLNQLFTNLTSMEMFKQYKPQVLSRPSYLTGDTNETANYTLGPWVLVLDNVVTAKEAERLIELGHVESFQRSAIVDGTANGTVYNGRTSSNAWCLFKCYNDTMAQSALARVSEIVNVSERNSEYWQLLQYQEGEFYENHHDYIPSQRIRQQGIRILTVYLYLNDVEEGGGTHFSRLNVTVLPKRGRALIWPSVLDEDPNEMDPRTFHEALPVTKGIKYGANAWIHMRDFKGPLHKGCITE